MISRPGSEPRVGSLEVEEDLSLLSAYFSGMGAKKRKAFFARRSNLQNYSFDPALVYTFDLYQHMVNLSAFQVDFGFLKYDLVKPLGVNPIQVVGLLFVCWLLEFSVLNMHLLSPLTR